MTVWPAGHCAAVMVAPLKAELPAEQGTEYWPQMVPAGAGTATGGEGRETPCPWRTAIRRRPREGPASPT